MVARREIPDRCRSRRAVAAAASGPGFVSPCGRADSGGGLPVTSAHFGIRTRKLAWRWGLDLRVAHCCLEHAGQYSGPGARRPGPPGSSPYPAGQAWEAAAVSRPQVIDDREHERIYERVAAIDVATGHRDGVHPHPAPVPARLTAGDGADGHGPDERYPRAGPPAAPGRNRDRHARVRQRLPADLVLRPGGGRAGGAAGQRVSGQEPARPAHDRQAGRDVAGPADRDGAAACLVRAARGVPGPARLHPGPDPAHPRAGPLLAAAG
jgi:hypothetical protein